MNDFDTLYLAGYIPNPRTAERMAASHDRWINAYLQGAAPLAST